MSPAKGPGSQMAPRAAHSDPVHWAAGSHVFAFYFHSVYWRDIGQHDPIGFRVGFYVTDLCIAPCARHPRVCFCKLLIHRGKEASSSSLCR